MKAPSLTRLFIAVAAFVSLAGAALAVPANFDAGVVSVNQTSATAWTAVSFTRSFASPPVVVAGPATRVNTAPLVVRVRNVTTTGFEIALDEWDYLDGVHPAESVHWFALTPGVHQFGDQRWEAGRRTGLNRTVQTQALNGFAAAPVVLAQIETTTNTTTTDGVRALKARLQNVTAASFQVGLETEVANNAVTLSNETIGYIAVSTGKGYLDGCFVHAVRTAATITNAFSTVTFPEAATTPRFLAQTQTVNDAETGELRMQTLGTASVQLLYAEEASPGSDGNLAHTAEEVGYLVLGDMPGETAAKIEFGDLVITQALKDTWTDVPFQNSYTTAVVVFGPVSYTNAAAVTVRVRSVTATGCQVQIDEWDHADGIHNAPEKLSYIVMEQGSFAVGGALWQAGRRGNVTQAGVSTNFATAYASAPALFAQVATWNDANAVTARIGSVTGANFNVELDESEIDATPHASETVHWLAVPQGRSNFFSDGMRYEAGTGTNQTSGWIARPFSRMHADPFLFAALQTKLDPDPATLRWRYLFADGVEMAAQEDGHPAQFGEGTVSNSHSAETVAFLTVQGEVDTDEDGAPNAWESSVGLNPNNAADGAHDPDGDLLTNQQEYHNRIDFQTSSSHTAFTGGNLTVSRIADAFERDDIRSATPLATAGRFRITRAGGFAQVIANFTLAATASTDTTRAPSSPADYTVKDSAGNPVAGSIVMPVNAQSVDVYIHPVQDALNEYVEGLRLTATSHASYTIGSPSNAVVLINDALDVPGNEKLFVGNFAPQGSAITTASGFATLLLNGPNKKARISTDFTGLTTSQTATDGSHVHFSNGDIVFGEPVGLPIGWNPANGPPGPLVDEPWNIVTSGAYSGQRLIDALYRKIPGESLYINVHTTRYSSGEIRANLFRQDNSPYTEPDAPPPVENLTSLDDVKRDCARFLTQATFGPTQAEIDALYASIAGNKLVWTNRKNAFNAWLAAQWAIDQTTLYDYQKAANAQEWVAWGQQSALPNDPVGAGGPPPNTPALWQKWGTTGNRPVPAGYSKEGYDPDRNNRRRAWWMIASRGHDQLRQRAASALEQIFVVSDREGTILNRHFGHSRYYDMLGDVADGVRHLQPPNGAYTTATGVTTTVRHLLEDISKSPMMGKYLSHLQNQKATFDDIDGDGVQDPGEETLTSPDENYAREIMQLFTIGLLQRHPDGSLKLGSDGKPQATYSNDDIKALAQVFTGWTFAWKANTAANDYEPPVAITASTTPTAFAANGQLEYFHPGYENPMMNFPAFHDTEAKTVLGTALRKINNGEDGAVYAEGDLDRALNALFNHENVGPFLSRLLIQRFVTSNPSRGYVFRVAEVFRDHNGATTGGVRGYLKSVINAILMDYEARSLTFVDPQTTGSVTSVNVGYGKVKEPILRYLHVQRAFNGTSNLLMSTLTPYGYPATQLDNLGANPTRYRYGDTVAALGQTPNNMPSVFNWYLPDYAPPGVVGGAGLAAPELQIMTENLVIAAVNYHRELEYDSTFDNSLPRPDGQRVNELVGQTDATLDNIVIDLSALTTACQTNGQTGVVGAEFLVDQLDAVLAAGALKTRYAPHTAGAENPRSMIIDQVALVAGTGTTLASYGARVKAALYLITSSPEFIVQK